MRDLERWEVITDVMRFKKFWNGCGKLKRKFSDRVRFHRRHFRAFLSLVIINLYWNESDLLWNSQVALRCSGKAIENSGVHYFIQTCSSTIKCNGKKKKNSGERTPESMYKLKKKNYRLSAWWERRWRLRRRQSNGMTSCGLKTVVAGMVK